VTELITPSDVAATAAEAEESPRAPLIVLEPFERFLDEHGVGAGELTVRPIGDGHSNVTNPMTALGVPQIAREALRRTVA
jgi:hypothetical protein